MGQPKKLNKPEKKVEATSSPEKTKEALLKAAKQLFSTIGYDGTTVKDISERAGVNISLVSYHFQGKEGLYRTVLEQFGSVRLSVAERILVPPSSIDEFKVRLHMFVSELFQWLAEEPELCNIIQREVDSGFPLARDIFDSTFLKIFERLHGFMAAAKKEKIIRSEIDALIAASALHGCIIQMGRHDKIGKEIFGVSLQDESHRKKVIEQVLSIHVIGLLKEKL